MRTVSRFTALGQRGPWQYTVRVAQALFDDCEFYLRVGEIATAIWTLDDPARHERPYTLGALCLYTTSIT